MNKEINNNIEEAYCSFEVSKLLFEKGFTQNQTWCYYRGTSIIIDKMPASGSKGRELGKDYIPCFTLDLAIEWIRVNFEAYVSNYYDETDETFGYKIHLINSDKLPRIFNLSGFKTPHEAKETAIKYTLKNLNEKEKS